MEIKKVGVVGCGLMGSGIAQVYGQAGYETIVREPTQELLDKGLERISAFLDKGVAKRKMTQAKRDETWARLTGTTYMADFADCDLVIEAIFEDLKAKRDLFAELDEVCKPETIFASNTSSLLIADMTSATKRPERVVGLHFFYPSVINQLLEVVVTKETSLEIADSLMELSRLVDKIPIKVKDAPGFAVNRFFVPWLNEATRMLDEGVASTPTIDQAAMEAFSIGMGPFALMNATGIPIAYHSSSFLARNLGPFYEPSETLRRQFEAGEQWDLEGEIDEQAKEVLRDRFLGVVFGVAAQLVDEGVATAEDTDRGATVGLRWAQGPFAMMNEMGVEQAQALVEALAAQSKGTFAVPELLREQAAQGEPWALRDVKLKVDGPVAIIITGAGNAFVAGADIREMQAKNLVEIREFTYFGQSVLKDIETMEKPVIAVINGFALGGGLELALACDIRLASSEARMGFPEVGLGIFPGVGGTQRSARLIGKGKACELIFTGDMISAEEAERIGLVNRVVSPRELMKTARTMAQKIASRAPLAVGRAKTAINKTLEANLDAGLAFEVESVCLLFSTEDKEEGLAAFVERRKPEFKGR
jgi:enoyl-CoA hydratase/3-hydroxyacyl-CoA dehydrogenase